MLDDKFPPLGTALSSTNSYYLSRESLTIWPSMHAIRVANAPTLGANPLQIPTHCPTWGRWGVTLIGALSNAPSSFNTVLLLEGSRYFPLQNLSNSSL